MNTKRLDAAYNRSSFTAAKPSGLTSEVALSPASRSASSARRFCNTGAQPCSPESFTKTEVSEVTSDAGMYLPTKVSR
jgi:hypothetical protein